MKSSSLRGDGERQERDVARALDRERHLALVARAVAADPTRHDLAALGDEVLEGLRVLVVDDEHLVGAVAADALAPGAPPARSVGVQVRRPAKITIVEVVV